MGKKIALLGSAPSSVTLAPFTDKSWDIWACSPGAWPHCKRVDAFFEIHRWEDKPWFSREYKEFLAKLAKPVYMLEAVPEIPSSLPYPKERVLSHVYGTLNGPDGVSRPLRFNPNDFGSTLSWMLALAIIEYPDEIGLWGVDMAANEEWGAQKDGCLALITIAKNLGIKVTTPPESDLLRPVPLYGFCEADPMHIKLLARKEELQARYNDAHAREQQALHQYHQCQNERHFMQGALDDLNYMLKTWVSDRQAIEMAYAQPEKGVAPAPQKNNGKAMLRKIPAPNGSGDEIELPVGV